MIFFALKNIGETSTEVVRRSCKQKNIREKAACCGKLDPMASGLLLIVSGLDCRKMERYLDFDKIYSVKATLGLSTDTGDILGKVTGVAVISDKEIDEYIAKAKSYKGKTFYQAFPNYSSIVVKNRDGISKPMWWWSKNQRLHELEGIPGKEVTIKNVDIGKITNTTFKDYYSVVQDNIGKINSKFDFRQNLILKSWEEKINEYPDFRIAQIEMKIHVTSGTYIRSFVYQVGSDIGTCAHAFEINRDLFLDKTTSEPFILQ